MKHYGLPYQGSKARLAERIVSLLPKSEHFYDLFAGGCAITHCAALSGKYQHVHANDISDAPSFFIDSTKGKYDNEDRWISREDFYKLKDADPYVRIMWSFSNNQRDYIYSKDSEPFKKAMHYAVYFRDPAPLAAYDIDVAAEVNIKDRYQRWLGVKHAVQKSRGEGEARLYHCVQHHHRMHILGKPYQTTASCVIYGRQSDCSASTESLLPPPIQISVTRKDYRDVEILTNSVVYADPPYAGTRGYGKQETFDNEAFYNWLRTRDFPVYVSEYSMPEDFIVVAEFRHRCTFSATANNLVTERVFVQERWKETIIKNSLFL